MTRPALARTVLALLLLAPACRRSPAPQATASPTPGASASEVVARVDGVAIRGGELDERVAKRLMRVRQEEYEIRRQREFDWRKTGRDEGGLRYVTD